MSAPESDIEQARIDSLVRCGSTTAVVMHLTELEETLIQRRHDRTPIVLCGAQNADDGLDVEELAERDCPGCVDCFADGLDGDRFGKVVHPVVDERIPRHVPDPVYDGRLVVGEVSGEQVGVGCRASCVEDG